MALALYDRVQETTATTGTGSITLGGAVSGYQSFAVVGNGNTCYYTIVNGSAWEVGIGTYSTTGPTLARTTILSNSNSNTSPITLSGASSVFLTYPAEKSVNLDGSGNVSALGTVSSGVWQGTTVGVAYGGTGVTTSSGANSVVLRDASQNVNFNNYTAGAVAVTAAAGTTVLTVASARTQILVGSAAQTFQLPDATTLRLGQSFIFVNNSSGLLTVKDNASTTVETVPSGGVTQLGAVSIATSAGSWGAYSFIPAAVDWGTNALNLATTVISGGTWQGGVIQPAYGGTGLSTFVAANNALYSSGASTLTAGTLPVAAGGTGITSLTANYIPVGNGTSGFSSSSSLQFASGVLVVGGSSVLGGATNPITAFTGNANNYIQTYVYNQSTGTSASADFVAYADNSTDAHGWADMGFTSSTYADPVYTVTGPNEAYVLGSALNSSYTGNLVYATDSTGSTNAHQWYVGGFTQLKSAYKMQLNSTGLRVAGNAVVGSGLANNVTIAGASTGSSVSISATGSDTNIDLTFTPKGTGNTFISSGSLGVGTTSILGNSLLNVAQGVVARNSGTTLPYFQTYNANAGVDLKTWRWGGSSSGGLAFETVNDAYSSATGRMFIDSSGNLGLGTTAPTYSIDVQKPMALMQLRSSTGTNTAYHVISNTGGNLYIGIESSTGSAFGAPAYAQVFYNDNTKPTIFYTNSVEALRITSTGGISFGSSGTGYGTAGQFLKSNGNAPPTWSSVSASPAGSTTQVQYNSAGSFAGSANLTFDGTNLTCGGTVTANSDETLKTNWRDLPADFVEQLAKVKRGTYDRVDVELTQDGVSAQSLQSLLPNSVLKGEDGKLSVAYGNAALVAAIALAERVVQLEARLAALEK